MILGKAEKLYLGNITTLDDVKPIAKALTVVGDRIQYVGSIETAKSLCDEKTEVFDFGENYIYPGFLEAHTHGLFAGYRISGQASVAKIIPPSREKYREVILDFIKKHPEKDMYIYMVSGWIEDGKTIFTSDFLDELCSDKPVVMNTAGGHSVLLNHAAMKFFNITPEYAKEVGTDLVRVDENGNPTGYVCEVPAVKIASYINITNENAKEYLLSWQDFAFSNGFTAVGDAGIELISKASLQAYVELEKENKLKLYTFANLLVKDNREDTKAVVDEILEKAKNFNSKHFNIIGAKVFLDGVLEAHTAWLGEDYADEPGYHGNERFNNPEILTNLIAECARNNLNVHAHSDGDEATSFFLDCIEKAQKITGNLDQRNALAHLQIVKPRDYQRMADTNSTAVVPPLWVPKMPGGYEKEVEYIGEDRASKEYPIKSFIDANANVVFHSDYPVTPTIGGSISMYASVYRGAPTGIYEGFGGENSRRWKEEAISRKDALLALTKNIAYMWHQEDNLGSLTIGKLANMTIVDVDLLNDDFDKLPDAKVVATIVDGNIVYKAK